MARILGENLRIGDVVKTAWANKAAKITAFEPYKGPHAWVCKIAKFADGSRMSISFGQYYECE